MVLKLFFVVPTDIADPRTTTPSLRLVNKASLDRVLQAEIYVNESDGQLRAAHLIWLQPCITCIPSSFVRDKGQGSSASQN